MKLMQKRGKQHDCLELDEDRIVHSWSLSKENGERATDVANLDPDFGSAEQKNEGKLPYFTIGFIFLLLLWFGYPAEGMLGHVLTGLFVGGCIASFVVGFLIRGKESVTILHLKDGSVFAVIRHHWVAQEAREQFLSTLQNKIEEIHSR
ncbi:MAG: hypothetical protein EA353_09150 [Puniceicoccaceae bacterium]|nr:MAG: hypothetical protein EA353_09150 [Puniceicoccaceae bacterium]